MQYSHMAQLRSLLMDKYSPAYGNKVLTAVRRVLKECWRADLMTRDEYAKVGDVSPINGDRLPAGRDLSTGEVSALMRVCCADTAISGVRDAAMLALGVTCGPRIAEVVGFDLSDYDQETCRLVIRGKGNRERTVFLDNGPKDAMADWLFIRGSDPGPLFVPILKGGRLQPTDRLHTTSVSKMLRKRAAQAGVSPFTWHDLRRTTVGDLLDAGVDLLTVANIVGHKDPKTTARYDRRGERSKQNAASLLHVPYTKKY